MSLVPAIPALSGGVPLDSVTRWTPTVRDILAIPDQLSSLANRRGSHAGYRPLARVSYRPTS